MPTPGCEKRRS